MLTPTYNSQFTYLYISKIKIFHFTIYIYMQCYVHKLRDCHKTAVNKVYKHKQVFSTN